MRRRKRKTRGGGGVPSNKAVKHCSYSSKEEKEKKEVKEKETARRSHRELSLDRCKLRLRFALELYRMGNLWCNSHPFVRQRRTPFFPSPPRSKSIDRTHTSSIWGKKERQALLGSTFLSRTQHSTRRTWSKSAIKYEWQSQLSARFFVFCPIFACRIYFSSRLRACSGRR